jgi:hypothetical protein
MAGEIISESVGGIIPERRAASPGIGTRLACGASSRPRTLKRSFQGRSYAKASRRSIGRAALRLDSRHRLPPWFGNSEHGA